MRACFHHRRAHKRAYLPHRRAHERACLALSERARYPNRRAHMRVYSVNRRVLARAFHRVARACGPTHYLIPPLKQVYYPPYLPNPKI
jgi:hypothetical protein